MRCIPLGPCGGVEYHYNSFRWLASARLQSRSHVLSTATAAPAITSFQRASANNQLQRDLRQNLSVAEVGSLVRLQTSQVHTACFKGFADIITVAASMFAAQKVTLSTITSSRLRKNHLHCPISLFSSRKLGESESLFQTTHNHKENPLCFRQELQQCIWTRP